MVKKHIQILRIFAFQKIGPANTHAERISLRLCLRALIGFKEMICRTDLFVSNRGIGFYKEEVLGPINISDESILFSNKIGLPPFKTVKR